MDNSTYLTFNPSNEDAAHLDDICNESAQSPSRLPPHSPSSSMHPAAGSSSSSASSSHQESSHSSGGSVDVSAALPLQYCWHIWEQIVLDNKSGTASVDYSENTRLMAKFSTVQEFWRYWYHMPQPSELLHQKRMVREDQDGTQHLVDALMIFKAGIKPMWEDACNADGGHFEYRLRGGQFASGSQIDEYWNNLVLGLVGNTIEHTDVITGVRLVDKLSMARNGCIRIEVWFTACDNNRTIEELGKSISKCMATKLNGRQGSLPKADKKMHNVHK